MYRMVKNTDKAIMITPRSPNSPPPSGKNARVPDAPIAGRIAVRISEPHAEHPIPKSPIPTPAALAAAPLPATESDRSRSRCTVSAICIPNKRAISTVENAEMKVKFVAMDPRSNHRKAIFSPHETFMFSNTLEMRAMLGIQITNANAVNATPSEMAIYAGRRRMFLIVRIIFYYFPTDSWWNYLVTRKRRVIKYSRLPVRGLTASEVAQAGTQTSGECVRD